MAYVGMPFVSKTSEISKLLYSEMAASAISVVILTS